MLLERPAFLELGLGIAIPENAIVDAVRRWTVRFDGPSPGTTVERDPRRSAALTCTTLARATLASATLASATLASAALTCTTLACTALTCTTLACTTLTCTTLTCTTLASATLTCTTLTCTTLARATLTCTTLTRATLTRTTLTCAAYGLCCSADDQGRASVTQLSAARIGIAGRAARGSFGGGGHSAKPIRLDVGRRAFFPGAGDNSNESEADEQAMPQHRTKQDLNHGPRSPVSRTDHSPVARQEMGLPVKERIDAECGSHACTVVDTTRQLPNVPLGDKRKALGESEIMTYGYCRPRLLRREQRDRRGKL